MLAAGFVAMSAYFVMWPPVGRSGPVPMERLAVTETAAGAVSLNSTSRKYHEPGCRYYDCNSCVRVTLDEALRQGGVPCKKCH